MWSSRRDAGKKYWTEAASEDDIERILVVMRGAHGIRMPGPEGASTAARVA